MKRVVSVSIGSSKRDHQANIELLGQQIQIERIGTDGDIPGAIKLIRELDGQVDAFGIGGMDLYIWAGDHRYTFREAKGLANAAKITPIVDGSGLKNTLERRVVRYLAETAALPLRDWRTLMVSGVDRFGMAEALDALGTKITYGDLIFALGMPIPLHSLRALRNMARVLAPIIVQLPFSMLYPTGERQETVNPKYARYYQEADLIAGDFHFIRRYMPEDMRGKVILTNTVTGPDVTLLRDRGVSTLITTTPEMSGRSFGTNVMEAALVGLSGKQRALTATEYDGMLSQLGFVPRIENLN